MWPVYCLVSRLQPAQEPSESMSPAFVAILCLIEDNGFVILQEQLNCKQSSENSQQVSVCIVDLCNLQRNFIRLWQAGARESGREESSPAVLID